MPPISLLLLPAASAAGGNIGANMPVWAVAPFVLLLLSIAVLPLVAHHWWESNRNRALVSFSLGIPFGIWVLVTFGRDGWAVLEHILLDYLSFIVLLGALYVIAGGIFVRGSLAGTPLSNTAMLAVGALLANLVGTTGASMVLIRPLLRAIRTRRQRAHVVIFFIFVVSNCGGLLTPFADPPLFLGFLKGIPFEWTLGLWKEWIVAVGVLLAVFLAVDNYVLDKEEKERPGSQLEEVMKHEPLGLSGAHNLVFLAAIVAVILGRGNGWGNGGTPWPVGIQEALMVAIALGSWFVTKPAVREANRFSFGPINEVAILFFGIFVTMIAPLFLLAANGPKLGLSEPWQFFWATGLLSSFLDNAPTYLAFAATAAGRAGISPDGSRYLGEYLATGPAAAMFMTAVSCGAVFMGAMTYIGNGPNFMVKAIAESEGVKMPSFGGYMLWSGAILVPIFVVITLVFFA
ncbi:MAG: sodium:proton antiporter [Planctomycetes bacterium]|nr:sodium:proton antiporter [Planctomycetota bacterium]